jgi:LPXTG-motif cell wall-anchored protein
MAVNIPTKITVPTFTVGLTGLWVGVGVILMGVYLYRRRKKKNKKSDPSNKKKGEVNQK